jgi:hypothetical protein
VTQDAGDALGMRVSPDDPRLIVLDDGDPVRTHSPVVELFVSGGVRYARTRPPDATGDVIKPVRWVSGRSWEGSVLRHTRFTVAGDELSTAGFTHRFPGAITGLVQLSDGAFVVAFDFRAAQCNLVALERDGRERWTSPEREAQLITRFDDPSFPDVLAVTCITWASIVHPWDGRAIMAWGIK